MRLYAFLLFLHVIAIVIWVGGMFVVHFAVRPSAAELLEPPQRLSLLAAVLRRFFTWVGVAVLITLASGIAMIYGLGLSGGEAEKNALVEGLRLSHPSVHAMFFVGVFMMAIYGHIRFGPFARLQKAVADKNWSDAAGYLTQIRMLVGVNMVLGVVTIAVATLGRALM